MMASHDSLACHAVGPSLRDTTPEAKSAGSVCCWPSAERGSVMPASLPPSMRSIPGRLDHYARQGAPRAGLCASAIREALAAPWQGLGTAAQVLEAVPDDALRRYNAPRGSIVYWTGGSRGFGHVAFAMGDHLTLSVDVVPRRPGVAGVVPFAWFAEHWPSLEYVGWSWYWGRLDTRPAVLLPPPDER